MEKALACLALLAAIPFSAAAGSDGPSYTYVEGGFDRVDQRASWLGDFDPEGGYVRGSYALTPSVYVFGGYAQRDDTRDWSLPLGGITLQLHEKMEQRATDAGLGFRAPMGEKLDFIGELSYFNIDRDMTFTIRNAGTSHLSWRDLDGARATVGLRGGNERVEGWVKLGYLDSGDFRDHFVGVLGAQYRFTRTWGLVAEYEETDEMRRYQVGLRTSFLTRRRHAGIDWRCFSSRPLTASSLILAALPRRSVAMSWNPACSSIGLESSASVAPMPI